MEDVHIPTTLLEEVQRLGRVLRLLQRIPTEDGWVGVLFLWVFRSY